LGVGVTERELSLVVRANQGRKDAESNDRETDLKCDIKQDRGDRKRVVRTFWSV